MGSLASPHILVSVQETAKYRFGLRGQMGRRAQRRLVEFNSVTGGQRLKGDFKIVLQDGQSYTPSLHPPKTCTELRHLWDLQWRPGQGVMEERMREHVL